MDYGACLSAHESCTAVLISVLNFLSRGMSDRGRKAKTDYLTGSNW